MGERTHSRRKSREKGERTHSIGRQLKTEAMDTLTVGAGTQKDHVA